MTQSLVTTLQGTLGHQPAPPPPEQSPTCTEPTGPLGGGQGSQSTAIANNEVHPQIIPPVASQEKACHSAIPSLSDQSGSESKMSAQKSLGFDEGLVNHSNEGMIASQLNSKTRR